VVFSRFVQKPYFDKMCVCVCEPSVRHQMAVTKILHEDDLMMEDEDELKATN
jgi:hypothetical protein